MWQWYCMYTYTHNTLVSFISDVKFFVKVQILLFLLFTVDSKKIMESDVIADLRCKLKETEEERRKAAQYGLQLVESQNELQNQLDKCRNEMMTLTEVGH